MGSAQLTMEYRAVAHDTGDLGAHHGDWRESLQLARDDAKLQEHAEPPYDRIWIEQRPVAPEPTIYERIRG